MSVRCIFSKSSHIYIYIYNTRRSLKSSVRNKLNWYRIYRQLNDVLLAVKNILEETSVTHFISYESLSKMESTLKGKNLNLGGSKNDRVAFLESLPINLKLYEVDKKAMSRCNTAFSISCLNIKRVTKA